MIREDENMGKPTIEFETDNGRYKLMIPKGRVGAVHMRIMTSYAPSSKPDKNGKYTPSPKDVEMMAKMFEDWSANVLPKIVIDSPYGTDYNEIPGDDQYACFLVMLEQFGDKEGDKEFFRYIE